MCSFQRTEKEGTFAVSMTGFSPRDVRETADWHDYKEISLNRKSNSISFRYGISKSIRIIVYCDTGTVGITLTHPKQGAIQQFRRNVSFEVLEEIFADPLAQTDDGYYRRSLSQLWQGVFRKDKLEWDSVRRWKYVCAATGLVKSLKDMEAVIDICATFDSLIWNKDDRPMMSQTKYDLGSRAGLINMLFRVAAKLGGVTSCHSQELELYRRGAIEAIEIETDRPYKFVSDDLAQFIKDNRTTIRNLKRKMYGLKKVVGIELLQWLFGKIVCGYVIIDRDFRELKTEMREAVRNAHYDYGELMYPGIKNICMYHGVEFGD